MIKSSVGKVSNRFITIAHLADTDSILNLSTLSIPICDIFIHSGNIKEIEFDNIHNQLKEINDFMAIVPAKHKIFVCGAREHSLSFFPDTEIQKRLTNCTFLNGKLIIIQDIKIYGISYLYYGNGDSEEEIKEKILLIPNETNILVTNSPPKSILDSQGVGLSTLKNIFDNQLKTNIKLHCFGQSNDKGVQEINGVTFSNASMTLNTNINFITYFLEESRDPFDLILFEMSSKKIPESWKWDFIDNYLINRELKKVLDVDKASQSHNIILWNKLYPTRDNQKWANRNQHLISFRDNLQMDISGMGIIRKNEQFYDVNSPEIFNQKWNVIDVSLSAKSPSRSLTQCWKYHSSSGLLQNMENGYFLGTSQFGRFVLVAPST